MGSMKAPLCPNTATDPFRNRSPLVALYPTDMPSVTL